MAVLCCFGAWGAKAEAAERIVSTAGAITETVHALGVGSDLVAVDISSVYPEEMTRLPQIGYSRFLSAEGIVSMRPTLVLLNEDAGPASVLQQLKETGVRLVTLPNHHTPEAAIDRIREIGKLLQRTEEAERLVAELTADLDALARRVAQTEERPRVLFIYTRGGGTMNVAGKGAGVERMIELAGGVNAVEGFEGYKPITAEGVMAARPDVILVTTRGLESAGGVRSLLKQPGIALTKAGTQQRVIDMDDLMLLGFGPRMGKAANELFWKLHGGSHDGK